MDDILVDTLEDALRSLPTVISLPKIDRPYGGTSVTPELVKTCGDLPSRFFVGSLDFDSFKLTPQGWKASYFDDNEKTCAYVAFNRSSKRLIASLIWKGIRGPLLTSRADNFSHIVRSGAQFPGQWDKYVKEALEDKYNVRYLNTIREAHQICTFPDGWLKTIAIPIPISKARDVAACHNTMNADPEIQTSISGYLQLNVSAVNYLEGRNAEYASSATDLYLRSLHQYGIIPQEIPVWETASDGSRALTLRRAHYTYIATFSFREIDKIIKHLYDHDIISLSSAQANERQTDGPEFCATIMQAGLEIAHINYSFFDEGHTRRVFYDRFSDIDSIKDILIAETSDVDIMKLIEKAERSSASLWDALGKLE